MKLAVLAAVVFILALVGLLVLALMNPTGGGHEGHDSPTSYQVTQCSIKGGTMIGDTCLSQGTTTYVPPL